MINRVIVTGFLATYPLYSTGRDGQPIAIFQLYHRKPKPSDPPDRRYTFPCVILRPETIKVFKAGCQRGDMICVEGSLMARDTPCRKCQDVRLETYINVFSAWNLSRSLNHRYGHSSEDKLVEMADAVLASRANSEFLDIF